MFKNYFKNFSWDFYSQFLIIIYCLLQIIRLPILPQSMDIYYHILTAWGFIQAGGYSGWDFWQYAPIGRVHIYPPVFHIILAFLIKLGISKIILAKLFEAAPPVIFLITLYNFVRRNYNERLAFFVTLMFSSSFSFYFSLLNHIPATLAFIFGFLALSQLFKGKSLRSMFLLALCFYTHIGISWFFVFSIIIYSLFNKENRRISVTVFISALILSLPILFKQLTGLKFISSLGFKLHEIYSCQIKIIDYLLAFFGLILVFKADKKYRLFLSFFLASLIFLIYPYRLFSAEGYLPIIFLSSLFLYNLYEKFKNNSYINYLYALVAFFILFLSPTISMDRPIGQDRSTYKINISDSAFMGLLFARGQTLWLPREYRSAAAFIKENSEDKDIIYASIDIVGMALASISERATANALFPEIKSFRRFDPISVSKIIIFTQDDNPQEVSHIIRSYNLIKIGENKLFILYKNSSCRTKIDIKMASVPFWAILFIGFVFMFLFWHANNINKTKKQKIYLT